MSKVKGIADIVFLLDVSGSMQSCIDGVRTGISSFIDTLTSADANSEAPIHDWRIKICGYRDYEHSSGNWFVDNPFVRDIVSVKSQLAAENMQARGGGDEPESLLDALYKIATTESSGVQEGDDPLKWRQRSSAARAIVFFTDATFKQQMSIPEAAGGQLGDLLTKLEEQRFILCGFHPEWEGYYELGSLTGANLNQIVTIAEAPALVNLGKDGAEGRAAQKAAADGLAIKAADSTKFQKTLEALAKTVVKSSAVDVAEDC
jgi:hypothetical protein